MADALCKFLLEMLLKDSGMFKLIFYVPKEMTEKVKNDVFATGAGRLGNYSHCSWQVEGLGQFRPNEGSMPRIGEIGKISQVVENRVEMLCSIENIKEAISALKSSHPYEVPEIAEITINSINQSYLKWLIDSTI